MCVCVCVQIIGKEKKPRCTGATCECPCYNATAYNYCSGRFTVTKYSTNCFNSIIRHIIIIIIKDIFKVA